jgi:hypothetical protein
MTQLQRANASAGRQVGRASHARISRIAALETIYSLILRRIWVLTSAITGPCGNLFSLIGGTACALLIVCNRWRFLFYASCWAPS